MKWLEFAKKVEHLLKPDETIGDLGFKFGGKKYRITSQWGSGENKELVNLWANKIGNTDPTRIYPFGAEQVDKLKFFRVK